MSAWRSRYRYYGEMPSEIYQRRSSDDYEYGAVFFAYDAEHRLQSRSVRGPTGSTLYTSSYAYNSDDVPTQVGSLALTYSYPSGRLSTTTLNKISDARTYDAFGDLQTYTATYTPSVGSPVTLYTYTLSRDVMGRISGKTETIVGVTATYAYTYDVAGRLTLVTKNGSTTDSFVYDSNGNRTSGVIDGVAFTATYDNQDRQLTMDSKVYAYNQNGDLTQLTNGSQVSTYNYDVFGNLRQYVRGSDGVVHDYTSDGMDRRAVKTRNGVFQYRYIYESPLRIAFQSNSSHAPIQTFYYATRENVPDYAYRPSTGASYRIITDHLGSVRLVVNAADGTIGQRMDYNTLGKVVADTSDTFQPFGFAGGIYDSASGLVRFGARDYNPGNTGRWTTKDPIRFGGGDTNHYGYVMNDPINIVDLNGLKAVASPTDKIEGGSIGGGGGIAAGPILGFGMLCDALMRKLNPWEIGNLEDNTGDHPHDIKKGLPNPGGWDVYVEDDGSLSLRDKSKQNPIPLPYDIEDTKKRK